MTRRRHGDPGKSFLLDVSTGCRPPRAADSSEVAAAPCICVYAFRVENVSPVSDLTPADDVRCLAVVERRGDRILLRLGNELRYANEESWSR